MSSKTISRRELLKGTGALVVSFSMWARTSAQNAPPGGANQFADNPYNNPDYLDPSALDSWIAITEDGNVTIFTGKVDLGTGVETALQQICAEELDVPFGRVFMSMGDTTARTVDQGRTAGSQTIPRAGTQLRQATAVARLELLKLASTRLAVPADRLTVTDGVVSVVGNTAQSVSYGQLVGGKQFNVKMPVTGAQWAMVVSPEVKPKKVADYKIVGESIPRVDLPPKFTGEHRYTADVRVPGMLHGRVVRPATYATKPERIDERSIANIPGIVKIVTEGTFVGIVAETEWAAVRAAKALKVTWTKPQTPMFENLDAVEAWIDKTKPFRVNTVVNKGNVDAALASGSKTFDASYRWPFQLHAMLGPSVAIADVQGDKVTIWAGSQGPFTTRDRVANLLKISKRNIEVRYHESAGCFGRLAADDVPLDAVLLSRAVGKPVRVQWSREDENTWEPKGQPQFFRMRAAVDATGNLTAWRCAEKSIVLTEVQGMPQLAERQVGIYPPFEGQPTAGGPAAGELYNVANQHIVGETMPWVRAEADPLRTNHNRSPHVPPRLFASECFLDEVAAGVGADPVEFRLRYLTDSRAIDVLKAAVEKAGWSRRPSPAPGAAALRVGKATGRGIAVGIRGAVIAAVAEVDVDTATGQVTVTRVVVAQDCGLIINPDGVKMQLDGNVIQGVSRALLEDLKFNASGVTGRDWVSYPILRFKQVPKIEHVLLNRPDLAADGAAESAVIAIPAAIGNAIFDATGVRMREAPFTRERVLSALKARASVTRA